MASPEETVEPLAPAKDRNQEPTCDEMHTGRRESACSARHAALLPLQQAGFLQWLLKKSGSERSIVWRRRGRIRVRHPRAPSHPRARSAVLRLRAARLWRQRRPQRLAKARYARNRLTGKKAVLLLVPRWRPEPCQRSSALHPAGRHAATVAWGQITRHSTRNAMTSIAAYTPRP